MAQGKNQVDPSRRLDPQTDDVYRQLGPICTDIHGVKMSFEAAREYFYQNWDKRTTVFQADCRRISVRGRDYAHIKDYVCDATQEEVLEKIIMFDNEPEEAARRDEWRRIYQDQEGIKQNTVYETYSSTLQYTLKGEALQAWEDDGKPETDPGRKVSPYIDFIPAPAEPKSIMLKGFPRGQILTDLSPILIDLSTFSPKELREWYRRHFGI